MSDLYAICDFWGLYRPITGIYSRHPGFRIPYLYHLPPGVVCNMERAYGVETDHG